MMKHLFLLMCANVGDVLMGREDDIKSENSDLIKKEVEDYDYEIDFTNMNKVMFCKSRNNPCNSLKSFETADGEKFGICSKVLAEMATKGSVNLKVKKIEDCNILQEAVVGCVKNSISGLSANEKQQVLVKIGVQSVGDFIESSEKLKQKDVESFKFKVAQRIRRQNFQNADQETRIVASHTKVGDYVYKQQRSQRGGLYWYLHRITKGDKKLFYLGKEKPLFNPAADLERLEMKSKVNKTR